MVEILQSKTEIIKTEQRSATTFLFHLSLMSSLELRVPPASFLSTAVQTPFNPIMLVVNGSPIQERYYQKRNTKKLKYITRIFIKEEEAKEREKSERAIHTHNKSTLTTFHIYNNLHSQQSTLTTICTLNNPHSQHSTLTTNPHSQHSILTTICTSNYPHSQHSTLTTFHTHNNPHIQQSTTTTFHTHNKSTLTTFHTHNKSTLTTFHTHNSLHSQQSTLTTNPHSQHSTLTKFHTHNQSTLTTFHTHNKSTLTTFHTHNNPLTFIAKYI
ncbi:hypothetical protein HELRODRAFT_163835 [Helobdella robusta]|uniref:Uncharacterized protein n=1 Tax=Helobdella robusta TaxID=6412 RepID=T1EUI9_HELRO|nr:hypothetical protein HELRODRAFT_163835 [Helobdella robusta]ESN96732.1 hypothetical protein HELRODRAFT_163835 [Helobdella robusta]